MDVRQIARAKDVEVGDAISFDQFDSTSRQYSIGLGEVLLAKNDQGYTLAARINGIADDTRGADRDEVTLTYSIFAPEENIVAP